MASYENVIFFERYIATEKLSDNSVFLSYLGTDTRTGTSVLIKILNSTYSTKYEIDRICFSNEVPAIISFDDPGILPLLEAGMQNRLFCVVYRYAEYIPLDVYIEQHGAFDVDTALSLTRQIASALHYAYTTKNILHRNIKSGNIGIITEGGSVHAKLYDFGMSYVIDYMHSSPEMIDKDFGFLAPESTGLLDRKVDCRSDLYSLGVVMYYMLTGVLPFHASSIDNMVYQHVAVSPRKPSLRNPAIPDEISEIILKLLSKDPDLRYQSAGELMNAIDRYSLRDTVATRLSGYNSDILQTIDQKTRLFGRKIELSQLRTLSRAAISDRGHIAIIKGGLGFGKSDLVSNFVNDLINNSIPYFRTYFTQQDSMTPYHGFREILDGFVNLFDRYDRKLKVTERSRLARVVHGLSDIVTSISPDMERVLPASLALPTLEGYKEQQRTLNLLASFFLSIYTQEKPFVLILDDIHYADAASLSLLTEIAAIIPDYKVFVVCSYRADAESESNLHLNTFLDSLREGDNGTTLSLMPFNEQRLCDFLSDILDISKDECQLLASYLLDKTEGNPYFTSNILRSMLEDGVISIESGRLEQNWDSLKNLNSTGVVSDIIEKRIRCLPDGAADMLSTAAVIGYEFSLPLLLHVTGLSREEAEPLLKAATEFQFIENSHHRDMMTFSHSDVHTLFIRRLSPEQKRAEHARIAAGLEAVVPDSAGYLYSLVYHFTEVGDEDGIYRYIIRAADNSMSSNATDDALAYYKRALPLIEARDGASSELWFRVKRSIIELSLTTGRLDDAISSANELLPLINDKLTTARLYRYIGLAYFKQSRFSECEKYLVSALKTLGEHVPAEGFGHVVRRFSFDVTRFLDSLLRRDPPVFDEIPDRELKLTVFSIYETLCRIYLYTDLAGFERSAVFLFAYTWDNFGSSIQLASAAANLSVCYLLRGKTRISEEMRSFAGTISKEYSDPNTFARILAFSALCQQWQGENEKSIKTFEEAAELFTKVGDRWELNNTYNFIASVKLLCCEYTEAIRLCNDVVLNASRLGDNFALCQAYCTLIICHTERGDFDQASALIEACTEAVRNIDIPYAKSLFLNAYGRLMLEQDNYHEAAKVLTEACNLIEDHGFINMMLSSTYSYRVIALIKEYTEERDRISLEKKRQYALVYEKYCEAAMRHVRRSPNQMIPAYRAYALFGFAFEKYKYCEKYYPLGAELISTAMTRYENACLCYEYGCYLLANHRTSEARFYVFEAYMTFSSISSSKYIKSCESIISEKYQDDFENNTILANVTARRNRLNIDRKINTLLKLGERLTSTLEIEDLQRKILQDAVELVGAERGILFLYPETGDKHLYVASVYNLGKFDCNTYDWMLEEVERTGKPIVINDVQSDEYRKHYTVLVRYGIKSVMAMPMFVRGSLFGVIYLDSRLVRHIFSDDYIDTMEFIANQAGAPISNARLYHRAITDGLTGIYGRSYLDNQVVDRTSDKDAHISAIMIDVDKFKSCNDTYGHPFGDKVLVQIAGIMKRISGDHGVSCRYGGEEFVVLLDSNDPEFVMGIAEKIRLAVENTSVAFNSGTDVKMVCVTISLGVSIWDPSFERIDLIEHADKALYYAKHHGRNRAVMWSPEIE